jgi:hypothetical protein
MRNAGQRQWPGLALTRLLYLGTFLFGVGIIILHLVIVDGISSARAAGIHQPGTCVGEHHGPYFGGRVVVDTNTVVCNSITAFGGTVAINGEVQGDIVVFGGEVEITGTVDGNIYVYGGRVTLQSSSYVHGDIHIYGGRWIRDTGSRLDGSIIEPPESIGGLIFSNHGFSFPFWSILTWLALGLLITSLLPEHVMLVRTTTVQRVRRSLIIGLLSILLAPPIIVVLIALILPIPLAIIVGLGLAAAWAFGRVAIGWLIGDYLLRRIAPQHNKRILQVVVGMTILALVEALPYIGWFISIGVGLIGLGAVFLSRFGTRLYGQLKQPLTL